MEIAIALILMALGVAVWKLKVIGLPQAKERLAHRLLASAAGDRARDAAIAAAMRRLLRRCGDCCGDAAGCAVGGGGIMGTHKEESRRGWTRTGGENPTIEQLSFGCLQRIADAAEKMADGFSAALKERDDHKEWRGRYCQWWHEEQAKVRGRDRQISNLRGQIAKLKKRLGGAA